MSRFSRRLSCAPLVLLAASAVQAGQPAPLNLDREEGAQPPVPLAQSQLLDPPFFPGPEVQHLGYAYWPRLYPGQAPCAWPFWFAPAGYAPAPPWPAGWYRLPPNPLVPPGY